MVVSVERVVAVAAVLQNSVIGVSRKIRDFTSEDKDVFKKDQELFLKDNELF
ncbi:hypothetical protein [Phocaeicola sartorii]|uniref:hypothetical protein n=1 Tax=Phocaeicola sartorii TaxID=671267 RepID=UPI003516A903